MIPDGVFSVPRGSQSMRFRVRTTVIGGRERRVLAYEQDGRFVDYAFLERPFPDVWRAHLGTQGAIRAASFAAYLWSDWRECRDGQDATQAQETGTGGRR